MTRTENTVFTAFQFYRSGYRLVSEAVSEFNRFLIYCLGRLFLPFLFRGLGLWTHLCNKHRFLYCFYTLFTGFSYTIDLKGFPCVPFTNFVTSFGCRMWAPRGPFLLMVWGKSSAKQIEEKQIKPVCVTLSMYKIYIYIYIYRERERERPIFYRIYYMCYIYWLIFG